MQTPSFALPKSLLASVALLTGSSFFANLYAQDETVEANDPWFSETHQTEELGAEAEKSDAIIQPGTNSWATYRRVMGDYRNTPENDLPKRLALLKAAISVYPKATEKHQPDIDAIAERLDALKAIYRRENLTIEDQFSTLAPFRDTILGNTSLLVDLLGSKLMGNFEAQLRSLGANEEFERIESLRNRMASLQLNPIFLDRFNSITRSVYSNRIERRWLKTTAAHEAPKGANYVVGQLIGSPNLKLALKIESPNNADQTLTSGLQKGVSQVLASDFDVITSSAATKRPDLLLKVDLGSIDTKLSEDANTVSSYIPGEITEEPNPDFMALSKKYEKEAKRYEAAMAAYGTDYEEYLRKFEDSNAERLENQIRYPDGQNFDAPPPPTNGGPGSVGESFHESTQRNINQLLDKADVPMSIIEPTPPRPTHLQYLEDLYHMPSTIVNQSPSIDYEYTQRKLHYSFSTQSRIAIASSGDSSLSVEDTVQLTQNREWTKNEGVHRSDPTVNEGDFSNEALDSAKHLFSLEFGARCAKTLDTLLSEALRSLESSEDLSDPDNALLALSLNLRTNQLPSLRLQEEELRKLAILARDPQVSDLAFQEACLQTIAEKTHLKLGQNSSS